MILCCGEALIDMLPCIGADGREAFVPVGGGAALNTVLSLGRLGAPAGLFSGISTDLFGQRLCDALAGSNVNLSRIRFSDRPTTLAFVHMLDGQPSYSFHDENSAGRMLTEADLPVLDADVAALHFSGISLAAEPCGSSYETLMRREHATRVVMLDPNIRENFIVDRNRHHERMRRMIAMADIVKLSDEDLAWFGESGNPGEIAARWLAMGPKLVVLTHGAAGATGYTAAIRVEVPAQPVEIVDTIGAGDAFNAGLLTALHEAGLLTKTALARLTERELRAALDFATKVAAVTVSRAGANPPWRPELG